MNLIFDYNKSRDAWCILNFGKTSNNSDYVTEMYKTLEANNSLDQEKAENFVLEYAKDKNLESGKCIEEYKKAFKSIEKEFIKTAERVFGVKVDYEIKAYLTSNQRYPYGISERLFFVPFCKNLGNVSNLVIMHELWHFYTWEKFGESVEKEIGEEKYNTIKESLTVLLNIECSKFMSEKEADNGYPQHKELRNKILEWWNEKQDIDFVWDNALEFIS